MRYRIGEFAALSGLSAKTLRFYESIGLLVPVAKSPRSGYRFYESTQLRDAASIRAVTELGMTLKQTIRFLRHSSEEQRLTLENLREDAASTMAALEERLSWISAVLRDGDQKFGLIPVTVRHMAPLRVASIKSTLQRYEDIGKVEEELKARIDPRLIGFQRGVIWHRCGQGELIGEAYVQISSVAHSIMGVQIRELKECSFATAYSSNDLDDASPVYEALERWLSDRGRVLVGPKREVYRGQLLEIQFPINC